MAEFVYFICDTNGLIKVGTSREPRRRLAQLQCAHGTKLQLACVVPGGFLFEQVLHGHWRKDRLNGEWFTPSPEIVDFIEVHGLRALPRDEGTLRGRSLHRSEGCQVGQPLPEALFGFLMAEHPTNTVQAASERTGLPEATIRKWFERSSFPSGQATLVLVKVYGPRLLMALYLAGEELPRWVEQATARERIRVIKCELTRDRRRLAHLRAGGSPWAF